MTERYGMSNETGAFIDKKFNKEYTDDEIIDLLNDLNDENERLQTQLSHFAKSNREGVKKVQSLAKENKQLKQDVEYWKQVASQYNNELNVFEHCKKYKTECKDIHWSSD